MHKANSNDNLGLSKNRTSITRFAASTGALTFFLLVGFVIPSSNKPQSGSGDTAVKAKDILEKNCAKCHNAGFIFDPKSRVSLIQSVVKPGDPDNSKVIQKIASGAMPPEGNPKVSPADLQILKDWVKAGAADWNSVQPTRPALNLSEAEVLKEIVADLESLPEQKRPYVRYFSSANLLRNPDSAGDMQKSETALGKLVNSLSWSPDIVKMEPFGTGKALYRLDIRDVEWTAKIWDEILSFYPYGFVPAHERGRVDQIRALSGAAVPYVRADWFIATASVPPLYHDILHLPDHVAGKGGLEELLGVDAAKNQQEDKVVRGGLENSGVSHNNRAVERHRSLYGYYYKSFDFASNEGRKNIFQFPMDFKEDGGEFVFSLPNGMQGYLIAKATGERLDVAPSNIVRDRSATFDDVNVTNGLSCISCHAVGMKFFPDQVRTNLDTINKADFDLDRAKLWYLTTQDLHRIQLDDAAKFETAVVKAGGVIPHVNGEPDLDPKDEPVTVVAVLYRRAPVSPATAAAECGLKVEEFQAKLKRSSKITELGLGLLTEPDGSVKRDIWEQDFGKVVDELGLGEYLVPTRRSGRKDDTDPRISIRIESQSKSALSNRLKSQLFLTLARSDQLKPVSDGGDKIVSVTAAGDGSSVILRAETGGRKFEEEGDLENFSDLAAKLADEIHQELAHSFVPSGGNSTNAAFAFPAIKAKTSQASPLVSLGVTAPTTTEQLLALALKTGSIGTAVSVDRGPGSTYRLGEEIIVRFSVTQGCFAALYDTDSTGVTTLLFPNPNARDNHLEAGRVYSGDTWKLLVQGTVGRERMFLLAAPSNDQLPGVNAFVKDPSSGGFISKSVGAFARNVQSSTQDASASSIGASLVEFFTAK